MDTVMTLEPDLPHENEEDYVSSEDDDFDPTAPAAIPDENDSSASEDEDVSTITKVTAANKAKRITKKREVEDLGFENSGDEATIKKGRRRKRKDEHDADEESGGEGGFVKTRSMRVLEETGKKPLASADGATIDVDALWKSMNIDQTTAIRLTPLDNTPRESGVVQVTANGELLSTREKSTSSNIVCNPSQSEEMITIESPYIFAGVTSIRKKLVRKKSPEALAYLESLHKQPLATTTTTTTHPPLRRQLKRPSRFEPNPLGIIRGLPASANKGPKLRVVDKSKLDWQDQMQNTPGLAKGLPFATSALPTNSNKAPKLNVVEKSKLDWAGYVDQEGIQDELKTAEKAKDGYISRTEFLGRVEANREGELRNVRLK